MKLSNIKLKWQIFGYILGFAAIIIIVFCVFQIFMLESMYKNTKINSIESLLTEVEEKIIKVKDFDNNNITDDFLTLATNNETAIYLFKSDGTELLIVNKGSYYQEFVKPDLFKEIIDKSSAVRYGKFYITFENSVPAPNKTDYPSVTKDAIDSIDSSIICAKFVTINNESHLLVLDARLAPVNPAVSTLKDQLVYISIIVVILTIIVALSVGYLISSPINKMTKSAKMFADGRRDIVFDGKGYQEIEELNNTLNYAVAELKKTEELQKELLANISHDLKTPITLISGYAELIKDMPEENNPENLQLIIDECKRLNALVNDLLDLSRLQSKTIVFNNSNFSITNLIKEIVDRQQAFFEGNGFAIKHYYEKEEFVNADANRISQVIYNFITNAINYSGDSNEIIIKEEKLNNKLRISVQDFGIGIAESDIDLIWNRYYRVDKTHQRNSIGTGLGLSIVKEILEYYNLNYGVVSEQGRGSVFYFDIPVLDQSL